MQQIVYAEKAGTLMRSLNIEDQGDTTSIVFSKGEDAIRLTPMDAEFLSRALRAIIGDVPSLVERVETSEAVRVAAPDAKGGSGNSRSAPSGDAADGNRPLRAGYKWTPEEEATMRRMILGGAVDIMAVSKELDRTPSSITSRLIKLGWITIGINKDAIGPADG